MGKTIRFWQIIVNQKLAKLNNLKNSSDLFEDLMNECKHYASAAGVLTSSVKEFPLLFAILFVNHKKSLNSKDE